MANQTMTQVAETAPASDNGSGAVQFNLENADKVQNLDGDIHAATEAVGGPEHHVPDATALGMDATGWVSLSMLVFVAVLIWKKVPALIARSLDAKIATIRNQLDEAARLRKEAEALKAEYEGRIASVAKEADAMRAAAEQEAADLITAAQAEAGALVVRRQKMAEDKIAAAERAAIADVRAKAAAAATAAAGVLIRETHSAAADKGLVDDVIGKLAH
ncbi:MULTISPECIES: F0F1 ATP synthase subunit B [Sphingobium]|uniref:F0F1 ATP synthase subunit B family protein n=1 Tax=Sphingobium TaxID=165695 RepID=UPI0017B624C6|nr:MULTISPECIES: F0F1 ATP synthase subunit B [Sphingobium]MCW2361563.1 F-type H+-transporting ATPase subunit b [Sphingobium sp. B10D3B]MCW2401758.1 F-type H+-transporting ATPase subunit b [Sphingobium sp. B10D7B]MCW2408737.1 F-type H+-transporting ATPase subunit b [Sphingobium xanthum]